MQFLIHVANALYVISYLVKDILWLRLLTIVAGAMLMGFYFLQLPPLWAAIGWGLVFIAINAVQVNLLMLERRPVRLTADEQRLYSLAFRALTPREFLRLAREGGWVSASAGEKLVARGRELDKLIVLVEGRAKVEHDGRIVAELTGGCFIGEMSFVTGEAPNADVVTLEPVRYVAWSKQQLTRLLDREAAMRAAVQTILGRDLAVKLRAV